MTKRIIPLILTLCLAVMAMTVMACAETIASGDGWVLEDDGTLSFSSYSGMLSWIDTARATYCEKVTSVVFYDGTDYIHSYAFKGCSNLSLINIPDTVTRIGDEAFYGCSSLTTVTIPSSVEEIGSNVFTSCPGLRSLVIENCGLEFNADAQQVDEDIVSQSAHTYSNGTCTVCGATDSDYVTVGAAELHDGYYTVDGTNVVSGDPTADSNITSYAYYSNSVLYLCNFSYTTAGTTAYQATIKPSSGNLTISLSGDNTIGGETYGIHSLVGSITLVSTDTENMGSLTINANSSLDEGFSRGIYCSSDVVIDGVSVTVSSGAQSIYSICNIYIKNSAVCSANNALDAHDDVNISDSTVEVIVSSDDEDAIACDYVYITASNVTLSGDLEIYESLTMTAATGGSIKIEISGSSDSSGYPDVSSETTSSLSYTYNDYFVGEYTYLKTTVVTHTHSYTSSVTTEATCTTDGVRTYTCTCGDSYTETIPATGHSYEATVTEPTCTEKGYTTYTCSVCGDSYTADETEATGHTYEAVVTAPTCTETGYTTYTCSVCGDTYTADETAATGHSYDEGVVTIEPTCTEKGNTTYTCSVCGATYIEEIAATGHSYEAVVTAPTCTETGYTTYTCSACGDTYTADETAALGHSYVAVVTAPTCTEQGYTTHTCSVCGDSYVDTYTAALGHSYEFVEFTWSSDLKTATATFKCKTCGDLYTVDATITGEGSLGVSAHIATVIFEGVTYTDTQTTGTSLLKTAADYTAVNTAIKKANALNASDYSNFEYVTAAIDLVNWNLNILNQETVNAYAELIEAAIANLTPIAEETVTITEPVEDSTTETEMEEVEESETPAESNPTTGVVLSLIPIALAMAGSVAGKRR